jgi:hypothetical protein
MLAALALALLVALGLGFAAYAISSPEGIFHTAQGRAAARTPTLPSAEVLFFGMLAFCYLLWATLPLSIGSSKEFDPGRLLMYPVSLRKLFAIDFVSEVTTLQSVFAIPAILAIGLGSGLARGAVTSSILAALAAVAFGLSLSKWLSTSLGSLIRKKRTRGETLIALIGAVAGLGGALVGQIAPVIFKHAEWFRRLRWTPPGAAAFTLTTSFHQNPAGYLTALLILSGYTVLLVLATYWIARRSVLGSGEKRSRSRETTLRKKEIYIGWELPLLSTEVSAIVEKELRYIMRNAQIRMMALMPLILVVVRLMNTGHLGRSSMPTRSTSFANDFFTYGQGLIATGGVLYVFLILAGLSCNQFAFEEGGMRTLLLSPIERRKILIGKNIAITIVALIFSSVLLVIDHLVFRDLTAGIILFAALSFITFAATMSTMGNWLSIHFPKRMKFGKRLNVSGVAGLLLLPMLAVLAIAPLAAAAVGYLTRSLVTEYVTLSVISIFALALYVPMINWQGQSLQRREVEVLEVVREPTDD